MAATDYTLPSDPFHHPSGGWGSVKKLGKSLLTERVLFKGSELLLHQNKTYGFACVSCSWAKPANPHPFEFCESGAKATAWEVTAKKVDADFFAAHSVAELATWTDNELEAAGRLLAPLRYDAASDHYVPVSWDEAIADIGRELRALAPESVVFYSSGRASLETSYLYQLMARMYGCNNLPDSSNMCHESTAVGLLKTIGVGVGTVSLDDFEHTDCIFFFGQNVGTNSPRMLHQLQDARQQRDIPIVTFNPLRETGLIAFANPQSPAEMLTPAQTQISTAYHQLKAGGDSAAIMGLCKALITLDDEAKAAGALPVLDHPFIEQHTDGFGAFADAVRQCAWPDIERESGLPQVELEASARIYAGASKVIGIYGMGLTQHKNGVQNVQLLSNLLLLRGNIGKAGAGICPVRGHSNVQGQRTVGITEKPELAPLDQLQKQFHFEPPRNKGLNTVEACEGIVSGSVKAFIGLGGNFIRAVPDTVRMEQAWSKLRLSVQISTKLNRNHVVHGAISYILPCLGRIEIDRQADGEQSVAVEDSTGFMHGSRGRAEPAGDQLRSEVAIVAALAKAVLAPNPAAPWDEWAGDYSKVRDAIAVTYPKIFHDFNDRMWTPGGFRRPMPAAERIWETPNKRANFIVPETLVEDPDQKPVDDRILRLFTIRSDGQFNTTVYNNDDHFRGIAGNRRVLLMHARDMERLGLAAGDFVDAACAAEDGHSRTVTRLKLVDYNVPPGCVAGYYPECNPLIPLWHHAVGSMVPAAKSISITLTKVETTAAAD